MQLSGNTIFISNPGCLPLHNLPVAACHFHLHEVIDPVDIRRRIERALSMVDLTDRMAPTALSFTWSGSPSYARISAIAKGIGAALPRTLAAQIPVVLMIDGDIGLTFGRILGDEVSPGANIVAIDSVQLNQLDYVDIGSPVQPANVVPVVVKSLLF
jgi:ethanolamine utilization protein EutA